METAIWGLGVGFTVWGLGLRALGLGVGFRVQGLELGGCRGTFVLNHPLSPVP